MLLTADRILEMPPLNDLLDCADINQPDTSYGQDIDIANATMLDPLKTHQERCSAFLSWASRHQPCLFGRFGAREMQGIGIDVCWIDESEIAWVTISSAIKSRRRVESEKNAPRRV
ncbi:MAG: hypothetical protein QM576_15520 [Rhodopseudomonas sp.]|uniref:hypothetical protein n=1 Tax=Rhodopseudomonas sp. TaxID=1078 RepID=UPI0039E59DF9